MGKWKTSGYRGFISRLYRVFRFCVPLDPAKGERSTHMLQRQRFIWILQSSEMAIRCSRQRELGQKCVRLRGLLPRMCFVPCPLFCDICVHAIGFCRPGSTIYLTSGARDCLGIRPRRMQGRRGSTWGPCGVPRGRHCRTAPMGCT
jgi:hypothetical protein